MEKSETTKWKSISEFPPPNDVVLKTCIKDENGIRNEQPLRKRGRIWWLADGSMYVYFTPTHWDYNI